MGQVGNVEVLHLSCEHMSEGIRVFVEFAFMSDHQVFTRASRMADPSCGWESDGWHEARSFSNGRRRTWRDMEELVHIAEDCVAKGGWVVEWNPEFSPAMKGFVKRVDAGR
jgi:hypothetical protein